MNMLKYFAFAFVLFVSYGEKIRAESLLDIRYQISNEFRVFSIAGQNEILDEYVVALKEEDTTGNTVKVTFDHETSVLTSYSYANAEFIRKYRKAAVIEKLQDELSALCREPHVSALRLAGITQRVVLLNREDDSFFAGVENVANETYLTQDQLDNIRKIQELSVRAERIETGKIIQLPRIEGCVKPIGWRVVELERNINSSDRTEQEICEDRKRLELFEQYDIDVYHYRETELVERVKSEYFDYIFSICEPRWWEFWKSNHFDE